MNAHMHIHCVHEFNTRWDNIARVDFIIRPNIIPTLDRWWLNVWSKLALQHKRLPTPALRHNADWSNKTSKCRPMASPRAQIPTTLKQWTTFQEVRHGKTTLRLSLTLRWMMLHDKLITICHLELLETWISLADRPILNFHILNLISWNSSKIRCNTEIKNIAKIPTTTNYFMF